MENHERRKRPDTNRSPNRERSRGNTARTATAARRRDTVRKTGSQTTRQRTVRPPREDIPEVVYTNPKPLHRGALLLRLASVVAVVAAVMMCLSVFFKVDTVNVSGAEQYTPWMVREASGIQECDSLLGLSKAKVASRIMNQLQYVDEVRVGINLPGTVNIEIKEVAVAYAIQASDNSWWMISSSGNVLAQTNASEALDYTRITGVQVKAPAVGQTVQAAQTVGEPAQAEPTEQTGESDATEETAVTAPVAVESTDDSAQRLQAALTILGELENNGVIGQVASVDVSNLSLLSLEYGQRIHVVLGDPQRLDYKISYMAQAISQLEDYETGQLDVSFEFYDEALFDPAEES